MRDTGMTNRGRGTLAALIAAAALLAGCTSTPEAAPTTARQSTSSAGKPASPSTVRSTVTSVVRSTVTAAAPSAVGAVSPPPPTDLPAPAPGTCPFLTDDQVAQINGQRTGTTQVTAAEPHPICDFYRQDGGWQATVRVIQADSPAQAQAAVDQHVPVADSAPADQPDGWTGGSMPLDGGTPEHPEAASIYAVAKGSIAVVAVSNQAETVKCRQLVVAAIAALGL